MDNMSRKLEMVYCNSGDQIADSDLKAKKQPFATGLCSRDLQLMVAYVRLHSCCLQKTLSPKQSVVEESRQGTTERPWLLAHSLTCLLGLISSQLPYTAHGCPATVGWDLPHLLVIRAIPYRHSHSLTREIPRLKLPQVTLVCVNLTAEADSKLVV